VALQPVKDVREIVRERCFEGDDATAAGQSEAELAGMQKVAPERHRALAPAVYLIAGQRMPDGSKVDPDLMRAAGPGDRLDQGVLVKKLQRVIFSLGLAAIPCHRHPLAPVLVAADGGVNNPLLW
jgi:hypothetical protein